ncbi:MAG: 16S rRNA (cytosine(1402)-N(4))-methyltransferase RsmH [Gammaproteobacteria bacterium]|nr:16S rRNA (cytosine(1402)-N(4))-methyltransferase RsmH [Gammaproteobacteria bacterium]MDH5691535.1 16S rRNA (cytosine(1402)-N(4))-methyltransferase RsmH [Gammaproteobacteria bacterium]
MEKDYAHTSVMLDEAIEALAIRPDGIYLDGTFGRGGHSALVLKLLNEKGRLYAVDKDPKAVESGKQRFEQDSRFYIEQCSFAKLKDLVEQWGIKGKVSGLLLDLGVSSPQLDDPERGFSFRHDGPLDMRMDTTHGASASERLASVKEQDLAKILKDYGEERFARRIAKAIIAARNLAPITTTVQLAEIIKTAHPRWEKDRHPATRSFQAIRIWVNEELDDLQDLLSQVPDILEPKGRLVVISFHSLEDRIVKTFIQNYERPDSHLPHDLPVMHASLKQKMRRIGKMSPPSGLEVEKNARSRSARMRVAERL